MAFPNPSSFVPVISQAVDGPTLTAAAAASCLAPVNRLPMLGGFWTLNKSLLVKIQGRISCAVTTPGTARFDFRTGPTGTIVAFDTGALNLNIVAKANVPFALEIMLTCRTVGTGTATTLFGIGSFTSEAVIGAPLPTIGGNGTLMVPVGTPAVGGGFDNTAANMIDFFFTQTVATGSMTVHNLSVWEAI